MSIFARTRRAVLVGLVSAFLMAQSAQAEPSGFPDLAEFSPANPGDYARLTTPNSYTVEFSTPFGYSCLMASYFLQCMGRRLPGFAKLSANPDECGQMVTDGNVHGELPAFANQSQGYCDDNYADLPRLSPGHKLDYEGVTCAVGQDFTACTDHTPAPGPRGFVLRQDGNSFVF